MAVSAAAKSSVPRSRLGASERPALRECWLRHDSSVAPRVGSRAPSKVETFRQDRNCSARGRRERSASRPRRTARPPLPRSARARPAAGWRARPGPRRGPLARGQRPQRLGLVGVEDERPEAVGVGSAEPPRPARGHGRGPFRTNRRPATPRSRSRTASSSANSARRIAHGVSGKRLDHALVHRGPTRRADNGDRSLGLRHSRWRLTPRHRRGRRRSRAHHMAAWSRPASQARDRDLGSAARRRTRSWSTTRAFPAHLGVPASGWR